MALCAIPVTAALAAVVKTDVEPVCTISVAANAYEVTLHSINHSPSIIKYNVKVEIVDGEVIVKGKYTARDGSGTGYSYVVTIGGILYGFNL